MDYDGRKCELCVLENVDPGEVTRDAYEYNIILYLIHIKRGATTLDAVDITDMRDNLNMCGRIMSLSVMSAPAMQVYNYFTQELDSKIEGLYDMLDASSDEIDAEITRVSAVGDAIIDDADEGIDYLDGVIGAAQGTNIGEITIGMSMPIPQGEWLLCDGGPVPKEYPNLSVMLNGTLPELSTVEKRFKTYIYGGTPVEV